MHLLFVAALLISITPAQPQKPNRAPEIASAPGLTALVFASGNSIWFSVSHDNGQTFSPRTELARVPVLAVGRHRGPRVVISGKTIVVSAVYGETLAAGPHAHGLPSDGNLVAWRSADGGRSWSKPVIINDFPGSAREGLHSMAAESHGELAAVWLDLRAKGTRLYGAHSKDDGATWSKNVLIYESPDGTICQCCDPSVVFSGKHETEVMFRNVRQGARDMYLADWNLDGQVAQPRKLGTGSWQINGCPMDGGGLAHRGGTTVTAWRRDETVYLDQAGQPEIALGDGKDVALTLSAKGPYVAWSSPSGIELHEPDRKQPVCLSPAGSFPALTSLANGSVLATWEQEGAIELKVIR
jgi:hypothetical protein